MLTPTMVVLGVTLGGVFGLIVLCGIICVCNYSHKKKIADSEGGTPVTMANFLHQGQLMNIYKYTEPVHPQANILFQHIYGAKETTPELVNCKDYTLKKKEKDGSPESGFIEATLKETLTGENENPPEKNDGEKTNGLHHVPKLRYSLGYERQSEELCVSFLEAIGPTLPNGDDCGSHCYVLGVLTTGRGQNEAQTSLVTRVQHTVWEEALVFPLREEERAESMLTLTLRNCDSFSRHEEAGEITLSLAHVGIPFGTAHWVDLKLPEKKSDSTGEVLLSLSYLPAANRLIVVVIKAKNIHSDKYNDLMGKDLLVKVNLKHRLKRMKKKQSKRIKHKINPVWNEMIMFEVPPELLTEVSVELEMVCLDPMDGSNRATTASKVLGKCYLGLNRTGTEKSHWQEMMSNPRRQIPMWHSLHA
uniref:Synaptotagmin 13 n=1 Tax=Leptobrachium leishanense TaxID=445787 RepID=A0A8C5QZQ6_9ANUR